MKKYSKKEMTKCFCDADWNFIDENEGLKVRKMINWGTFLILMRSK